MPFVSIIIPIYNSASCLEQCLESIRKQTFTDFEVILVNDGSTDTSREICLKYAIEDNRYVLIDQKNSGVSAARNNGMDAAKGDWITFIDSDDWIDPDYLLNNCLIKDIEKADAICNLKIIINNNSWMKWKKPSAYKPNDVLHGIINGGLPTSMWCYFFNRNSVANLRVDTGINHYEDLEFLIRYFINNRTILFREEGDSFYHYRQGSITHRKLTKKTISGFKVVKKCQTIGIDDQLLNILFSKLLISISLIAARDREYNNEFDSIIKKYAKEYLNSAYYKRVSLKSSFIILLLSINPKIYFYLYACAHLSVK